MWRSAMLLLVVAVACGRGPTKVGAPPSWRASPAPLQTTAAEPTVFAPAGPAVAMYNQKREAARPGPLADAVLQAVRQAAEHASIEPPFADARLFRACEELAQIVPEKGVVAYRVVEFVMQRNGLIEPSPHLLVVWGDLSNPALIVEQLQPHIAGIFAGGLAARVGIGAATRNADGSGAVVFALQASSVTTNRIPRTLPEGGSFQLSGSVSPPYRNPEVLVTGEDGQTRHPEMRSVKKAGDFSAKLSCADRTGKQQIEISALSSTGATVLANFPIWCGESPPTALHVEPVENDPSPASAEEAEQRLLALINRDRRTAGLAELEWSAPVAEVARKYSAEMRRTKAVAHLSPISGAVTDRLRAANLKSGFVLENVARAYGVGETHAGLMDSPGHRQNLLSPQATHIGIGVALGDLISGRPEMFVTQVFTRVAGSIDERQAADALHALLGTKRTLTRSAVLERVAQGVAARLAKGEAREAAWAAVDAETKALSKSYKNVASVSTVVPDVALVKASALLSSVPGAANQVGIGVAQGTDVELGEGAIWIVLLLGELQHR